MECTKSQIVYRSDLSDHVIEYNPVCIRIYNQYTRMSTPEEEGRGGSVVDVPLELEDEDGEEVTVESLGEIIPQAPYVQGTVIFAVGYKRLERHFSGH